MPAPILMYLLTIQALESLGCFSVDLREGLRLETEVRRLAEERNALKRLA